MSYSGFKNPVKVIKDKDGDEVMSGTGDTGPSPSSTALALTTSSSAGGGASSNKPTNQDPVSAADRFRNDFLSDPWGGLSGKSAEYVKEAAAYPTELEIDFGPQEPQTDNFGKSTGQEESGGESGDASGGEGKGQGLRWMEYPHQGQSSDGGEMYGHRFAPMEPEPAREEEEGEAGWVEGHGPKDWEKEDK